MQVKDITLVAGHLQRIVFLFGALRFSYFSSCTRLRGVQLTLSGVEMESTECGSDLRREKSREVDVQFCRAEVMTPLGLGEHESEAADALGLSVPTVN